MPSGPNHNARPASGNDDDALLEACIRGEAGAWEEFVDRFGRLVYAIPSRLGLPGDACDDVFQAVFSIVIRELPRIRDRRSVPRWLMTVAHHESYRWIRSARAAQRATDAAGQLPRIDPEPAESDLIRLEQRQILHEGVEQLGGRCGELLRALFLDARRPSYQEIAAQLKIPVGAIGPTRNRCLRKLLELIGSRLG